MTHDTANVIGAINMDANAVEENQSVGGLLWLL